jgi:hypothetical protein
MLFLYSYYIGMSDKIPIRYIPFGLSKPDVAKQKNMLRKSKKLYQNRMYYTRKKIASFKSKQSHHVANARRIYTVDSLTPSPALAKSTGCNIDALKQIVKKGEGAYYSSGSRPNQTPQSWGLARLASSLTSGKSAAIDYDILEKGCHHQKTAFRLANKSRKKYGYGHGKTRRRRI